MTEYKSDLEIARLADKQKITNLAKERLSIDSDSLIPYGHYKAKLDSDYIKSHESKPDGKLILVTAMTPTTAGEGKTTTSVGLTDGLNHIGKNAMVALREPSLGPCFGMKGGCWRRLCSSCSVEDINLHFTEIFTQLHLLICYYQQWLIITYIEFRTKY